MTRLLFLLMSLTVLSLLMGCTNTAKDLEVADTAVTTNDVNQEMNDTISNHIVQKYAGGYSPTEKQFEVHKVYGTSKSPDGDINVYMHSYYGGFNKSTGTKMISGHSFPAVIRLKKEAAGYSVREYKEPQDGNLYRSSLQDMFPAPYLEMIDNDKEESQELQKAMNMKVEQWLKEKYNPNPAASI
ncbi:hypothetical protein SY83_10330 [Paenibacillus swuensis]|uniref:Lipoprotein n=1 Tax=Paenibacillus swuensis TaxID=1178515 RepID=A0A172TII7_9BACL|nr:hypothetical protein [Paenibacillus swuensis]ANE46603.1 hypothetical protein SY83_10330 [Paenibacillus swuensis]